LSAGVRGPAEEVSVKRGLVLAGGGVAGIAWEIGVLRGIEEVDPPLAAAVMAADVVIGTSAGSTVAAPITGGAALADLYAAQLSETSPELAVRIEMDDLLGRFARAVDGARSPDELRRRIGALAIETATVDEPARRAVIEARLPNQKWPDRSLMIVAVDAESGQEVVFDGSAAVSLVDAVAASCAVPGVWPPVTIAGHRYMDGGVRSATNADLAAGCDRVIVLSPAPPDAPSLGTATLADELKALEPAKVAIVYADAAALSAFGTNPLSPETRRPSAEAGREQGRAEAGRLAAVWW
jgi:NTE family protein